LTKATVAEARAEIWFDEYLALGEGRSIRRLAAEAQQTLSRLPKGQALPSDEPSSSGLLDMGGTGGPNNMTVQYGIMPALICWKNRKTWLFNVNA